MASALSAASSAREGRFDRGASPPAPLLARTVLLLLSLLSALAGPVGCGGGDAGPADAANVAPDAGDRLPVPDGGQPDAGSSCDPPCGPAQYCDESVTPGLCVEACSPPLGCPPAEVCNLQTLECEATVCAGLRCATGQLCADPALGSSGGSGDVCTCLPSGADPLRTAEDSCARYGLVCGADPATVGPWTCRRPLLDEPCLPTHGCSAGLECRTIYEGLSRCVRPCARSSDCPDLDTFCVPQTSEYDWWARATCRTSYCADPAHPRPGLGAEGERALYFQACTPAPGVEGTCLPTLAGTAEGPREVGLCRRAGALAVGAACIAGVTAPEGLCAAGARCAGGTCLALCDLRGEGDAACALVAPGLVCSALEPGDELVGACRAP